MSIAYSKWKAKTLRDYENELTNKAQALLGDYNETNSRQTIDQYNKIKKELEQIPFTRANGSCIRSKARWYEFVERSTKYFLNLERRNYVSKSITKLIKDNGNTITDPDEILDEQKTFYENLYVSQRPDVNDSKFDLFFKNENIKKLNKKGFKKNKSPGTDSLTAEFYLAFWNLLGELLVVSLNYAFSKGELSISQQRGIIRLLPKKKKDPLYLKNWRPISLLNVDYKIATKALATRLKKVLPSIISNSQTGYLEGRFIGENIRHIADVLQFTLDQNLSGIAVFLDFEKAFDSLEWDVLRKALQALNLGENFRTWTKVMYKNISSCVINNGFSSPFFTLQRGVRQGCLLSGLLFIIAVELLSISLL